MSNVILSVCIATYNRSSYIGHTIDSILCQSTVEGIEVVILDSGSTDNTEDVIRSYNSPLIKYHFHPKKFGVDVDYNSVFDYATGVYCWLFTDDDLLKQGSLKYILDLIHDTNRNFDYIIVNADLRNIDMTVVYKSRQVDIQNDLLFDNSCDSQDLLFAQLAEYTSFIGCLIIKAEFWRLRNKELYFGTEFVHVGVLFQKFYENQVYFVSEPFISIRLGNSSWSKRSFKIWLYKWPSLIYSFDNYSLKMRETVLNLSYFNIVWKAMYFRAIGAYDYSVFREVDSYYFKGRIIDYTLAFLSFVPKSFLKCIFLVYSNVMNKKWMGDSLWK